MIEKRTKKFVSGIGQGNGGTDTGGCSGPEIGNHSGRHGESQGQCLAVGFNLRGLWVRN